MILHRITSREHTNDLSGTGAMLYGGRWNQKGTRLLYTSESLSLAALEVVVNLSADKLDRSLFCVELDFPDHLKVDILKTLPKNWNSYPHTGNSTEVGTNFVKNDGLCLKVPSVIIPTENNYLINPTHFDFHKIKLVDARPLILDKRIFKHLSQ